MLKKFKGVYVILSSMVIALLNVPLLFAKSTGTHKLFLRSHTTATADASKNTWSVRSAYDSLSLSLKGLSRDAYSYAEEGLATLIAQGKLLNDSIISIVDFSQPSSNKRLYVIDTKNYKILFNSLVAHGRNSGREYATQFSNQNSSYMSSPGFYVTGDTYEGHNGLSLRLDGMEKGINDRAEERGIVMHGAPYVSEEIVNMQGYSGRSQGCPAVPVALAKPLINKIKNGSCVFIYHPSYVKHSEILN